MVATTNIHRVGTKAECEGWLERKEGGSGYPRNLWPMTVASNRFWRGCRYRDGQHIIKDARVNPSYKGV